MGADRFLIKSMAWENFFQELQDVIKEKGIREGSPHAQREKQVEIRTVDFLKINQQLEDKIVLRRKIETALRESEERFRMLAENSRDVIYRMSLPDGIYEYMSPAIIEIFGYTPQECYQNPLIIRQMLHPDWVDYFDKKWMELIDGKLLPAYEFKIIHKSGEERWVQFRNVLIRDANENPIAIEGIGTDITMIKQAEMVLAKQNQNLDELVAERTSKLQETREALEIEKERYRLIFNSAPIGIYHYDADSVITECNPVSYQVFGTSFETAVGFNQLKNIKNKEMRKAVKTSLAGSTGYFQGSYTAVLSGKTSILKVVYVPVFSESQKVTGGVAVVEDISDQVKASEKLAKSEEKYRTILESIEDGYYEVDLTGNLIFFNNALCDILGYPASELKGKNYRAYMDAENAQKTFQTFNQVFETGKSSKGFDWEVVRKDGNGAYLDTSVSPILDAAETVTGFRGVTRDVSERRLMEKSLVESEERYRLIFDKAPVGIIHYTTDGTITECNKQFTEMIGAPDEKLIGFNPLENMTNEQMIKAMRSSLNGEPGRYYGNYTSVSGNKTTFAKADFVPVYSEDGRIEAGIGVIEDLTDKVTVEKALRDSEEKYRGLEERSPNIIILIKKGGQPYYVSPSVQDVLGFLPEDLLGKLPGDFMSKEDTAKVFSLMGRIQDGVDVDSFEVPILKKDGTPVTIEWTLIPIKKSGVLDGYQALGRDITEKKIAEDALKSSRQQLRELSKHLQQSREQERASIAREIHDDLGQSLTAIKMDAVWLKNKIPEDQTLLMDKTEGTISLLDSAIQSVKRISAELRPGLLDDLGLSAAIEWQAGDYQKRSGINIRVTLDPEEIFLDEDMSIAIFRVCQESLTNVIRHSGATDVQVKLIKNSETVELIVADNGCGICEEEIVKKNSFGLIGMRERIHSLGGEIKISPIQGNGTKVAVQVPIGVKDN